MEAIQTKMDKLKAQADALIAKQSSGVIEKIRELMAKHGITTADIDAHAGGKQRAAKAGAQAVSKGSAAAVKYRDPKSGATWSGHGRAPGWLAAAKNRDKFLGDGSTAAAAKGAPASTQPAMYQDPTSGATWSGRGRAPAWLANVKDRSKFLIAGGAEAVVATNAGAVSKAKVAVKKASKAVGATSTKGQPKGPQPAKYRDPKSGATWRERGPAPAWLAGAKDRAKFLIAGVGGVADSSAASKPKAVAKKPATKTAVAKKASAKKLVGAKKVGATTNVAAAPEIAAP